MPFSMVQVWWSHGTGVAGSQQADYDTVTDGNKVIGYAACEQPARAGDESGTGSGSGTSEG